MTFFCAVCFSDWTSPVARYLNRSTFFLTVLTLVVLGVFLWKLRSWIKSGL